MEDVRDDVVGAPLHAAAKVIGVSVARLRRWSDRGLVVPSFRQRAGRRFVWAYTLEELVQGRVVRRLEDDGVHITQIEVVVAAAKSVSGAPLSRLSWGVSAREAFVQFPTGEWYGGRKPAQSVMIEVLDFDEIRAEARKALMRPAELAGKVSRKRGVQGNRSVFAGSRVPVDTIRGYVEAGFDDERILSSFPALYPEDVALVREMAS